VERNMFHLNVTLFARMEYAPAETKHAKGLCTPSNTIEGKLGS
jgi:hypothetical protein